MAELLRDSVYQTIRQAIISCELPPGHEMREQILAEKYRVSRSPIRDALLRLEQENLVTVLPRQGYRVKPLDQGDLKDLFGLRLVIAPSCAAGAALANDTLTRELDQFRHRPAGEISAATLIDYDQAFHRMVADLAGNSRLAKIENNLIEEFERVMAIAFKAYGVAMLSAVVDEHVMVIDAIQAHHSEAARQSMANHIVEARQRIMQGLNGTTINPVVVPPGSPGSLPTPGKR
jgi:GntR family transcriptional regulator, rspAB operon transcriptional repressor